MSNRYKVVLTKARKEIDAEGNEVELPVGSVVNVIIWDGISPYDPDEGVELVAEA